MIDLADVDFGSMTRAEILSALMDATDGGPASFADEPDDGRGRLVASFADDEGDGHWVTMEGEHVFIKGGKIEKGPSNLVGKSPSDLPPRSSGGEKDTHEKTLAEHLNEARAAHAAAVEAAVKAGKPVSGRVLKDYPHLAGDKTKGAAKADSFGKGAAVTKSVVQQHALDAMHELIREKHSASGVAPIHEVREEVRKRLGDEAASHRVFDPAVLAMHGKNVRLSPITDMSRATKEQLNQSIPGIGETLHYMGPVHNPTKDASDDPSVEGSRAWVAAEEARRAKR